jgi:hypothetical protein
MFKDYLFFSNNLQDAAKQILEAQEAQAKKENVEAVEPGPNEPMGQPMAKKWFNRPPSYEDDPTFVGPPAPTEKPLLHLIPDKNVPNEKDDQFTRMLKAKNAEYDKAQEIKNLQFREEMREKQRLARQRDEEEAKRQGMTIENYYKIQGTENERKGELEQKQEELRQNPRGVPMRDLA